MQLLAFLTHYRVNIALNILTLFLTIYVPQKLVRRQCECVHLSQPISRLQW